MLATRLLLLPCHAPPAPETRLHDAREVREDARGPLERHGHLWDEAQVDVTRGQRRMRCNEACVATHELDDADAAGGARGLDLRQQERAEEEA